MTSRVSRGLGSFAQCVRGDGTTTMFRVLGFDLSLRAACQPSIPTVCSDPAARRPVVWRRRLRWLARGHWPYEPWSPGRSGTRGWALARPRSHQRPERSRRARCGHWN